MKRITSLLLCTLMLSGVLTGCSSSGSNLSPGSDLMSGVQPQALSQNPVIISGENAVNPTDFAVRLFQSSFSSNENTLISPVSVLYALSMTANGAKGETLAQMEDVLGMSVTELNAYLKAYMDSLPDDKKNKLSIANSIWLTDDDSLSVEQDFLQANANYYGADIFKVSFDEAALKDINSWVSDNTDGMIEDILEKIPADAIMYLINAMAFDAEWKDIYTNIQIHDGIFTAQNGAEQNTEMMHSEESLYLEDGNATGFIKHYANSQYAFDAAAADFSGLGTSTNGNIFISRVLHKTFIAVDEKGTKAGVATVVEMAEGVAMIEDFKEVILDRPFVYMIIDCEANLPLFIGTMMEAE